MNPALKKIVGVAASTLILAIGYYGSYLPLKKSQAFITTLQSVGSIPTLEDFKKAFSTPLDMPSPVGQEELVRNMTSIILNIVQQGGTRPEVITELLRYVTGYYQPIITYGKGMSFEQNLYVLGALNEVAFVRTKNPAYLEAAQNYFLKGHELGPKRPQFLYGLFDVYRFENNPRSVAEIGRQILDEWPQDGRTRAVLVQFLEQAASAPQGLTK